jgi:hypothetical protein
MFVVVIGGELLVQLRYLCLVLFEVLFVPSKWKPQKYRIRLRNRG